MIDSTRRSFLATAGAGAAAVGIGALAPSAGAATPQRAANKPAETPQHAAGALVAHVPDVHGDTLTVMVGEREVVVHDRELVARLATAAF